MSTKHYFPSVAANTLVPRALRALVNANPHLTLDESKRVVACRRNDVSRLSVIGGGGSGHEPAWSGFVGEGLLSAAACGDIFASPTTKQVLRAMDLAPSDEGTILLITNYTGDRLHFGLAAEKMRARGHKNVTIIAATDDVSIGRSQSSRVGRRGMPGHVYTMKILCAAAAEGWGFDRCVSLAQALNAHAVSIGSALDHCHVPGRQHQSMADDVCVIGAGIHNEPGQQLLSPFPSVSEIIQRCLALLCDPNDTERAFVDFNDGDKIALLINNYGGLSPLELGALTDEVQTQLAEQYAIKPVRTLSGTFETSLNAPGFSISLCNFTAAAVQAKTTVPELETLLNRPVTAASWPNIIPSPSSPNETRTAPEADSADAMTDLRTVAAEEKAFLVDVQPTEKALRTAFESAIAAEPLLTEWDMVMGDGDCGEAVKAMSEAALAKLRANTLDKPQVSVLFYIAALIEVVDDMSGTLGAIMGLFLSAFYSAIRATSAADPSSTGIFASSIAEATKVLQHYTPAREGDRTVMDVLIPFADAFAASGDLTSAVKVAGEKAEATRLLKPKLGRASYVGEASKQELPDPGAWALYVMIRGFASGLGCVGVPEVDPSA